MCKLFNIALSIMVFAIFCYDNKLEAKQSNLDCKIVPREDLSSFLKQNLAGHNLVFFASWCGGCKDSLEKSQEEGSIAIAVFDNKESAQKALQSVNWQKNCFVDQDNILAKHFKITSLPAQVKKTDTN